MCFKQVTSCNAGVQVLKDNHVSSRGAAACSGLRVTCVFCEDANAVPFAAGAQHLLFIAPGIKQWA